MTIESLALDTSTPAQGRFLCTPHPVLVDGQRNQPVDLRPGETLAAFLSRHVEGFDEDGWQVSIGGDVVPRHLWHHIRPKHGQHIEARGAVGRSAMALVAQAALLYFTFGFGTATAGWWGAGAALKGIGVAAATGIYMAGSIGVSRSIR